MGEPLRILIAETGFARVAPRLAEAGITVDPVFFVDRERVSYRRALMPATQAAPTGAWFSLDLFVQKQEEAFLDTVCATPSLRFMQSGRAGYDDPAFVTLARNGVELAMSKGPAPAIAEYVLSHVLDRFQRGPERRAAQAAGEWRQMMFREVQGSTWLLVGFGAIGREIAVRARALGVTIVGVRRSGGSDADADRIVTPETIGPELAAADVVVLSVPLTAESTRAYGATFFAGAKPGALFLNVGRGPLIDDDALKAALDSGHLSHAVLDVTQVEPLPPGEWQWRHPRVTLTAHTSGVGSGLLKRTDDIFVENLRRYRDGAPLLHRIDPALLLA
ncbi:NAD(P)-dependent oxidoreductase [Sphingomonas profundi]|uniref:NAD(P)-dependent oxidoreductase n=1 Tax=Alterirhizorhabdus profundi TaxID=2681549 RepID=UPI0012E70D98|nr:NAD(P)-dependent oxidoreductase [Sphingomonas profundi]